MRDYATPERLERLVRQQEPWRELRERKFGRHSRRFDLLMLSLVCFACAVMLAAAKAGF